jgi:hypothetical protein
MAKMIQAVNAYRPRIDQEKAASVERFMELITQRTTLSPGVVKNVQESEVETLIGLLREGRPVHTGTAIYTPNIDVDGKIDIKVKVDGRLVAALNAANGFEGTLINAENIGKSSDELAALWNAAHPDDLVS